jgi:hypothetical protein
MLHHWHPEDIEVLPVVLEIIRVIVDLEQELQEVMVLY